jgi:hypothetical protein
VGRLVVLADVGLELDDPGGAADPAVIPDQPAAEQRSAELQGREREDVASRRRYRPATGT